MILQNRKEKRKENVRYLPFLNFVFIKICCGMISLKKTVRKEGRKDISAIDCNQLELKGYPTGLGKNSKEDRVNTSCRSSL